MPITSELLLNLATALALGLLIGAERGWSAREIDDNRLVAGIRTFGLAGLLGGVAALLGGHYGAPAWIAVLAVLGLLLVAGYIGDLVLTRDQGMTSEIALLLTFLLGSLALFDHRALAAGGAVVVALLLSLKQPLHAALQRLSADELSGALKLLFISGYLDDVVSQHGLQPTSISFLQKPFRMEVLARRVRQLLDES